jgi:hypothetical protein
MKTKFKEIITEENFILNSKIFDLGRSAEIIAKVAQDKMVEDGRNAKIHASNVVNWMLDIAEQAQKTLDLSRGK